MKSKTSIRYFEGKPLRAVFDYDSNRWFYSAVDLAFLLVDSKSPRKYWNTSKRRHPELSSFCRRLKLLSDDGKKYLSDVINEDGIQAFCSYINSGKYKDIQVWLHGGGDTIDEKSKARAYELFNSSLIDESEVGTTKGLQQIHAFLFGGLYDFAGQIRTKTISKGGFTFANGDFLPQTLERIDNMPDSSLGEILNKYVEMNVAHPFMEGNGRATIIWLDLLLKNRISKMVDWSKISKEDYLSAMKSSPVDPNHIFTLIQGALTDQINEREIFYKGIDYSYYYEEIED